MIAILWGNTIVLSVVKISSEGLSLYSNKIESVGLIKGPYYRYLNKKLMSEEQTARV